MATINTVKVNFKTEYTDIVSTNFTETFQKDLELILVDGFSDVYVYYDEEIEPIQGIFKYVGSAEILLKDLVTSKMFTDRYSVCSIFMKEIK